MKTTIRTSLILAMALLLTACFKVDMTFDFQPDETVSGEVIIGISKEAQKQMESLSESFGDSGDEGDLGTDDMWDEFDQMEEEGITVSEWSDEKWEGRKLTFDAQPIADFNDEDAEMGGLFEAVYAGDTITVKVDMGETTDTEGMGMMPGMDSALPEVSYTFSFPGKVTEATDGGVIDGNKVTYSFKTAEEFENAPNEVTIVAGSKSSNPVANLLGDSANSDGGSRGWLIGALVAVLVLVGGTFFLIKRRKGNSE